MPVMDGFVATRLIRASEQGKARHTPVVAMTANAIHGDRERCLEAGMDDYLAKPIGPKALQEMLQRWLPEPIPNQESRAEPNPGLPEVAAVAGLAILDAERSDEICGGDLFLYREILQIFLDQTPQILQRIEQGIVASDFAGIKAAAHELAGSSSNIGADQLHALARKMEQACQVSDLIQCKHLISTVRDALGQLLQETRLRGFIQK
jgi:HPt (histidine-containing phosphotransfer) domain-containing protein